MKWRCALIQQRLPDYPDGELSPFWKRLVASHVQVCPECRQELEGLSEVVGIYKTHPFPDPGPEFWQEFDRELHLKLVQANQIREPAPRYRHWPHYLAGATAVAGILALAVYLGPFLTVTPAPKLAHRQEESKVTALPLVSQAPQAPKTTAAVPGPPPSQAIRSESLASKEKAKALPAHLAEPQPTPAEEPQLGLVAGKLQEAARITLSEEGMWPEEDFLSWDVDTVVADLSREERQDLKIRLESRR